MKSVNALIEEAGLTPAEIGARMGLDPTAIYHKIAGRRRWSVADLQSLRVLLSERLGRPVSLDEMAADPDAPSTPTTEPNEEVA